MRLGLITDVHEQVERLRAALECFRAEGVDRIVFIGDVFEVGERIEETCRLLAEADAIGVWGNHDFGLCFEPSERIRSKYPASVLQFMGTLRPRLILDDCHFCHIEPWLDPEVIEDLWFFEGPPDRPDRLERIFAAVPQRWIFSGHYHRWLLATPDALTDWAGDRPVVLAPGRFFVTVGALCEGRVAILDTDTSTLLPLNDL